MHDKPLTMVDLFAGAGGLSEGLSEAGFVSLFANEFVDVFASTYSRNHSTAEVLTDDIRNLDPFTILKSIGLKQGDLDLLAGGPPCQGFSINAPFRSTKDARNQLFRDYLRFVDAFSPRVVLIENVPGLVSFERGATLHAIIESLTELGYGVGVRILGAANYGIPQTRWRTIIIGTRGKPLPLTAFPLPTCRAPVNTNFTSMFDGQSIVQKPSQETEVAYVTVSDAISDLPPLENGEKGELIKQYLVDPQSDYQKRLRAGSSGVYNHEAPRLSEINLERIKYIRPGGNWTDIPTDLLPKGMMIAKRGDHTKRYGRVEADGLASTIMTKCDPHWGSYFHYSQDRSFTVREAARIQSFPDSYVFNGNLTQQFAQVGNAVPPLLAEAVGNSIRYVLENDS